MIHSPYVDNIMVHADPFHAYCVALVVTAQQALEQWALKEGISYSDILELCQKEETVKQVQESLFKVSLIMLKLSLDNISSRPEKRYPLWICEFVFVI